MLFFPMNVYISLKENTESMRIYTLFLDSCHKTDSSVSFIYNPAIKAVELN